LGCIFDLAVSLRVNSNEHRRNRSRHVVSVDAGEEHDQAEECDGIKERSYGKKQAAILEADGRRKGKGTHAIEGGGSANKAYREADCSSSPSTSTSRSLITKKMKKGRYDSFTRRRSSDL
jgi:hypothetical protein